MTPASMLAYLETVPGLPPHVLDFLDSCRRWLAAGGLTAKQRAGIERCYWRAKFADKAKGDGV